MKKIEWIVSDLDGTLLNDQNKYLKRIKKPFNGYLNMTLILV